MSVFEKCSANGCSKKARLCFVHGRSYEHSPLRKLAQAEAEIERLRDLAKPCECSEDEACRFVRERDEARSELAELRDERSRLLGDLVGLIDARDLVREIRDSLKAADVHECYRGVRAALEHYDDRRERGGE